MAKLSTPQIAALQALKSQLEASKKNPSVRADGSINPTSHQPYMDIKGAFNPKTINVLVRKGFVDTSNVRGTMVAQINRRGLDTLDNITKNILSWL